MDPKDKGKGPFHEVDSQLWHVCAGGLLQMPSVNSKAFYFVQGHLEHANGNLEFKNLPTTPSFLLCKVEEINYLADRSTDEVFAKIRLAPVLCTASDFAVEGDVARIFGSESPEVNKPDCFAKTLTQSDANNGGGFSVPRYCAETIFPRLDYSADPPVQNIVAKDVHGEPWKFRHIYRGTPRRHLLTTGWSTFVNAKRLIAGDSIVFMRAEDGDLCVGIRRAKKFLGCGGESQSGWTPSGSLMQHPGFASFVREDEHRMMKNGSGLSSVVITTGNGKVNVESVVEAANRAAKGLPFEVVYYPRAGTPEFVVKAADVNAALHIRWCPGMRFRMPFETEDSSRVSWFTGTVSSVQAADPLLWSDSPWRLLQVTWDEPDLLQNVRRVSPWLVQVVSNMPAIYSPPFSPSKKKFRLTPHCDVPMDGQLPWPTGPSNLHGASNPFGFLPDISPAGMQGARHAQFGVSLPDCHKNQSQNLLYTAGFPVLDPASIHSNMPLNSMNVQNHNSRSDDVSRLPAIGNCTPKKSDELRAPHIVLFGRPIMLTEEHLSPSWYGHTVSPNQTEKNSSKDKPAINFESALKQHGQQDRLSFESLRQDKVNRQEIDFNLETGLCKVSMESEDSGRDLNLSLVSSYGELCSKLAEMYGIEGSELLNRVVYRDAIGSDKPVGDEPFSEFVRRAKKLTIMGSVNHNVGAQATMMM